MSACDPHEIGNFLALDCKYGKKMEGYVPVVATVKTLETMRLNFAKKPIELVIILDRSGSMSLEGRMENAKTAVMNLARIVKEYEAEYSVKLSVIVFNNFPHLLLPSTLNPDPQMIKKVLYDEDLNAEGGTNFQRALELAVGVAKPAFENKSPVVFGLFTDGEDSSSLRGSMAAFLGGGMQTALLNSLRNAPNLCIFTIGIGKSAPMNFLREIASFSEIPGETVQISDEFSVVMGCMFAAMTETVPLKCAFVIETKKRGDIEFPVSLRVGGGLEAQAAFFTNTSFKITFKIDEQVWWTSNVVLEEVAEVENEQNKECVLSALENVVPSLKLSAFHGLQKMDFSGTLEEITFAFECLCKIQNEVPSEMLEEVQEKVNVLKENIGMVEETFRGHSGASTVEGADAYRMVQAWNSASQDMRSISGGAPLVPQENRELSNVGRSLSQRF